MDPILIIDSGHGGKDPGGGTNHLWKEKDFALQISLYQYERFRQLGIPVALTRDEDVFLSSVERARIVRESGAEYCFSNHINAGGGDGVETIHSIHANPALATLLAQGIVDEGQNLRRVFSRRLTTDPTKDYFFMHRETGSVKTTIIEYGFADSKLDDVEQLQMYWMDYAEAVVKTFTTFIGREYKPPNQQLPEVQRTVNGLLNGNRVSIDSYLMNSTTYVPLRFIAESFGAEIEWNAQRFEYNIVLK
ncbi:N-acetylmuramoyl-L-alanine amidase [Chengkuizengella axinellae]|uniref:N-acetylmuramoyl-L-alanine amidase n=1 Tax=Chengkuizengella axinellae TaxID=3064388 RepID=A0ABT9J4Z5_9BACL|nr:N-acetylmuramoyl-L-alanine amidase [Chengkuizengella sp. 2205SS18-9]MDP5276701.1 N-acetylmuramoyl-L-alanine amidase [Chengkuizengella sp. 2205SS18-9]